MSKVTISGSGLTGLEAYAEIIASEVNVKQVEFVGLKPQEMQFRLKIAFKRLAKRLPQKIKAIIGASKAGAWQLQTDGLVLIAGEILQLDEFELLLDLAQSDNSKILTSQTAFVTLDTELDAALLAEGTARDLVRLIQSARKEADLAISDKIEVIYKTEDLALPEIIEQFSQYIQEQTLAVKLTNDARQAQYVYQDKLAGTMLEYSLKIIE